MSFKIVVYETNPVIEDSFKALSRTFDVQFIDGLLSAANVSEHKDAHVICTDQSVLNIDILAQFNELKMIAVRSTGYDHIDIAFCNNQGIAVCNVPGYAANAVAEHTFALLLAISRHFEAALQYTRKTRFQWDGLQGFELQEKTLAVIGTGAIGKRVAEIACGFSMKVVAYDLMPDEAWAHAHELRYVDFEIAISCADVISLNVPMATGEGFLIGDSQILQMKDGVVIINTARGELVDPQALVKALDSGKVSAAGLDVLPDEHYIREKDNHPEIYFGDRFDSKNMLANNLLCQHPNVVVTPHIGWYTVEADLRALDITVSNIKYFESGNAENVVNP